MELEDRNKIEMDLEQIIHIESRLICAKHRKIKQDKEAEREKNELEKSIKSAYYNIARVKRQAILRQKGLEWSPADFHLCEEESEKEFQRWKNFTPEEKIREHRERIGMLQNDVPPEGEIYIDGKPLTDIQVDLRIEEEVEKEIDRLEKLTPAERWKENVENAKLLQEAEKNNWYCST